MGKFLLLLTNLAFPFAALGVVLGFFFSPRRKVLKTLKEELKERFAGEKPGAVKQGALWVHCASVGEVKSVAGLLKELKKFYKKEILLTTSTAAGKAEAQKNPDIAQKVGQIKGDKFLCVFSAETDNGLKNATAKLIKKHANLCVLNDVKNNDVFGSDTNVVTLVTPVGHTDYPKLSKTEVANIILDKAIGK